MNPLTPQRTWNVTGLRTRYSPKSRVGQGLFSICPWLDLVLIVLLLLLLDRRLVLQPGVVVDLPRGPFREGAHSPLVAVVTAVRGARPGELDEIVFFGDLPHRVRVAGHMARLRTALEEGARRHPGAPLILAADRRVSHGTLTDLVNMAVEAGLPRVELATRTEPGAGPAQPRGVTP